MESDKYRLLENSNHPDVIEFWKDAQRVHQGYDFLEYSLPSHLAIIDQTYLAALNSGLSRETIKSRVLKRKYQGLEQADPLIILYLLQKQVEKVNPFSGVDFVEYFKKDREQSLVLSDGNKSLMASMETATFVGAQDTFLADILQILQDEDDELVNSPDRPTSRYHELSRQKHRASFPVIQKYIQTRSADLVPEVWAAMACSATCYQQVQYYFHKLRDQYPGLLPLRGKVYSYITDHEILFLPDSKSVQETSSPVTLTTETPDIDGWIIDPTFLQVTNNHIFLERLSYTEVLALAQKIYPNHFTRNGVFVGTQSDYRILIHSFGQEFFSFRVNDNVLHQPRPIN